MTRTVEAAVSQPHRFAWLAVTGSAAFFFARLVTQVGHYAVDVPFLDQWDFLRPFFEERSLWSAFRLQHGPHRQGVGALVIAASNALTQWDMRVLSFVTTSVLVLALLITLWLKCRLYGPLSYWDALLPPLFFRLSQYESLIVIPNPAHGAVPLVLILATCLTLTGGRRLQLVVLPILGFMAVHTGFGFLLPPLLLVVLLIRSAAEWKTGLRRESLSTGWAALLVLVAFGTFFIGFDSTGHSIRCPDGEMPAMTSWLAWPVVMVNRFYGLGRLDTDLLIGATFFVFPAVIVILWGLMASWSGWKRTTSLRSWSGTVVPVLLLGYTLSFALASAWARICGGVAVAQTSRYVAHVIPFGVGLYFSYLLFRVAIDSWGESRLPRLLNSVLKPTGLVAVFLLFSSVAGSFALTPSDRVWLEQNYLGKVRWTKCMAEESDAVKCTALSQFTIHPDPASLGTRVDVLRRKKLSFYSKDRSPAIEENNSHRR